MLLWHEEEASRLEQPKRQQGGLNRGPKSEEAQQEGACGRARRGTHPKCVKLPALLASLRWMAAALLSDAAGACSPPAGEAPVEVPTQSDEPLPPTETQILGPRASKHCSAGTKTSTAHASHSDRHEHGAFQERVQYPRPRGRGLRCPRRQAQPARELQRAGWASCGRPAPHPPRQPLTLRPPCACWRHPPAAAAAAPPRRRPPRPRTPLPGMRLLPARRSPGWGTAPRPGPSAARQPSMQLSERGTAPGAGTTGGSGTAQQRSVPPCKCDGEAGLRAEHALS